MPTYQYRCQSCRDEFEVRQSFTDETLTTCPDEACGGPVSKVFSGVGISFKGDGFYKNDHGSSAKSRRTEANDSSSGSGSDSDSSSGASSTSDSSSKDSGSNDSSSGSKSSGSKSGDSPASSTSSSSTSTTAGASA
ncbi:MAG: FmdB family transcriptional regulator [Acidimicrobiaceae bacterium]|nr:FmdB family transcriptional regulator [Acidimicrobiaceae bacterium]|tara:strand:+ start:194 stop:601 length:408 start_codon:yes stop_codon:yes gene_type:complete